MWNLETVCDRVYMGFTTSRLSSNLEENKVLINLVNIELP